jgi:hypothetical protein
MDDISSTGILKKSSSKQAKANRSMTINQSIK